MDKNKFKSFLLSLDPAEVQAYINIAVETITEIVAQRGMTVEQLRARRKQILQDERAEIDAELESLPTE